MNSKQFDVENTQNVNGGGIDSPILGKLTTSTASQKRNYALEDIQRRVTSFVSKAYLNNLFSYAVSKF